MVHCWNSSWFNHKWSFWWNKIYYANRNLVSIYIHLLRNLIYEKLYFSMRNVIRIFW